MAIVPGQIPVAGTAEILDTVVVTVGGDSVHREIVSLADPENPDAYVEVDQAWKSLNVSITGLSGTAVDMFGRLRVSNPVTIFDSMQNYDAGISPTLNVWEHYTDGAATLTHSALKSRTQLSTGTTANGNFAERRSHLCHRYQPFKSHFVAMTGILIDSVTNANDVFSYIGCWNEGEGFYFGYEEGTIIVGIMSGVSGSPVYDEYTQANWNVDKMDGSGPSGLTINPTKTQIFWFAGQWLGVGTMVMGLCIDGRLWPVHEFHHANSTTDVYLQSLCLPCNYSIEINGAGATAAHTMNAICAAVMSEGGVEDDRGYPFSANNGIVSVATSTTRKPILSIQPKQTFNSRSNWGHVTHVSMGVFSAADCLVEVVYNGTLTGPSWTSADANSICNYDVTASAITGGTVVSSVYASSSGGASEAVSEAMKKAQMNLARNSMDVASGGDILSVCVRLFSSTSHAYGYANWQEYR